MNAPFPARYKSKALELPRGHISRDYCNIALDGELEALWCAFAWSSSPQGHHHWMARAEGEKPLSSSDKAYQRRCIREGVH